MKTTIICLFFLLSSVKLQAQILVYQDVFKGGVTGDAFNPWTFPNGGNFKINIEPGSTIRKALLLAIIYHKPTNKTLSLNNIPILLSYDYSLNNSYELINNSDIRKMSTLIKDVTNIINPTQNTCQISGIIQPPSSVDGLYCEYYLYVAYENHNLPEICANVFVNNIQPDALMTYSLTELNPINSNLNVSLAINSSHFCDTIEDGSYVKINNNSIGLIGGQDENGLVDCAGVMGSFYYQNGTLTGMRNDVANNTMSGTDAIANIESYLQSSTEIEVAFEYQSNFRPKTNPIHQLFLTYTTSCEAFEVSTSKDTVVCRGEEVPLFASGGQRYEWRYAGHPINGNTAPFLSCSDCPNPVFSGDSSAVYTVRIWNNDTCSVVRHVLISVKQPPVLPKFLTEQIQCGSNNGYIEIYNITENGILFIIKPAGDTLTKNLQINQNTLQGGLGAGTYTLFVQDSLGCISQSTTLTIPSYNNTVAQFVPSPTSGSAPLTVNINNASQQANQFEWYVNGTLQNNPFTSFVADSSGTYQIMLVAWKHDSQCADTAYASVIVYDSLMVSIPNVFTPNNDGINDFFSINSNLPIAAELVITNRWGNTVFSFSGSLAAGSHNLWDGTSTLSSNSSASKEVTEGVYFYSLTLKELDATGKELSGSACSQPNCELKKEGFVTVWR